MIISPFFFITFSIYYKIIRMSMENENFVDLSERILLLICWKLVNILRFFQILIEINQQIVAIKKP